MSAKESSVGHSLLRFSSVSSEDSLPLGCEHKEYYWIKRYRALKRSIHEEIPEARPVITEADAHKFKRLPCTRFYLDRDYQFLPEFRDMLGVSLDEEGSGRRFAMLRTQESLVISAVSSRWFHLEVTRPMRILVGATNEGKRLQPQCLEEMKVVLLEVQRGDRVKVLITPSLGYGPSRMAAMAGRPQPISEELAAQLAESQGYGFLGAADPSSVQDLAPAPLGGIDPNAVQEVHVADDPLAMPIPDPVADGSPNAPAYRLKGDMTVFVNDRTAPDLQLEHEFVADQDAPVYGLAVWAGTLSDLKVVEH